MKIVIETESKEMADLLLMVTDRRESADIEKCIHEVTRRLPMDDETYLKKRARELTEHFKNAVLPQKVIIDIGI